MRTRIVRRFLWSAFLLLAISLLGVDLYVTNVTARDQLEDLRAALDAQARILAAELPAGTAQLDTWVKNAAAQTGAQVTVLDRNGSTTADSVQNAPNFESPTFDEFLSVTGPAPQGATRRLSKSLDPIHARVNALRLRLFGASLLSLALASGLTYIFVRSF